MGFFLGVGFRGVLVPFLEKGERTLPREDNLVLYGISFDRNSCKKAGARCGVTDEMLALLDVLVDRRFVEEKKNIMLLFRGSSNQRLIDVKKSGTGEVLQSGTQR